MAFSLACDASKTTLRIEGEDNNVTWNDVANTGAGSVAVDGVTVAGAATPAVVNSPPPYEEYGTYNSKPYYRQLGGAFFIWWDGGTWYITDVLGEFGAGTFYRNDPSVLGVYAATGGWAGIPTVALDTEDPSFFVTEHIANAMYQILKNIQFGDGTNALTFYSKNEMVYFDDNQFFAIKGYATLQLGEVSGDYCINGAYWSWEEGVEIIAESSPDAACKIYGSKVDYRSVDSGIAFQDGTIDFRNSIFHANSTENTNRFIFDSGIDSLVLKDLYINNLVDWILKKTPDTIENVWLHHTEGGIYFYANATAEDILVTDATTAKIRTFLIGTIIANLVNPQWTPVQSDILIGGASGVVNCKYTCDIHVVDKDGNNLQGVTVLCEDEGGNQVFSAQTGADGKIAQQTITYKKWEGTAETETEYSPHKFTFSKNGYTLLVMENVTVDTRINWDIEVKFPERIRARMANLSRLAILR